MTNDEYISAVRKYRPAVLNYCISRLHNYQDAQDMTNTVFFKIWRQRKTIGSEVIIPYMKTITRNSCIDALRRRKIMVDRYPLNDWDSPHYDHTEDLLFLKEIEKIIDTLPDQMRRLIRMRYFEGVGPGEIAEQLGLSESSIRNQLCTGLKRVRGRVGI